MDMAQTTALAVRRALREESGSILVFLPGAADIKRTAAQLGGDLPPETTVHQLFGALPQQEQDAAIAPPPEGRRKVVLATSIAETSLTIEGIRVVIDAGYARVPRFDPGSGMTRLTTERVSTASADQRRGRAGRLGPGLCYRLWSAGEDRLLKPFPAPEIQEADLAPLVLELAQWGVRDATDLKWLDLPPQRNMEQAREVLQSLGALGADGGITAHGRALAALPIHPRLAHMVLMANARGFGRTACAVAALIAERDILRGGADMRARLARLIPGRNAVQAPPRRISELAARLARTRWLAAAGRRTGAGRFSGRGRP
jgi:ATP-dependent helicase HrpB